MTESMHTTATGSAGVPLWSPDPDRAAVSQMSRFRESVGRRVGVEFIDSAALHHYSVTEPEQFWAALLCELLPTVDSGGVTLESESFDGRSTWFPDVRMNVAELILDGAGAEDPAAVGPDSEMLIAVDERGRRRVLTRADARRQVGAVAAALRAQGVGQGDRVAVWLPNTIEAVTTMLAAASIGAVFSSCSPDFGVDGVTDRFGQIEPTVLVAADGYTYGGKSIDRRAELAAIVSALPSLAAVVVVDFLADAADLDPVRSAAGPGVTVTPWQEWVAPHEGIRPEFCQLPFDHPWYVLFSSGTTGVPKCIVHRAGGVLLQNLKEHRLQLDIGAGDRVAYFTTCGWMMWNWLASIPASGATAVLYEGNPFHPGPQRLWTLVEDESLTFLGVSAKYLDAVAKSGFVPSELADLCSLRTLASTGSPLSPESFEWVYRHVAPGCGPGGLHVASISGGTDLCACFVLGDPTLPVHAGEIQTAGLGMDVDVVRDDGSRCDPGERGELVCGRPFPSMPLGFWGDGPLGSVGERYHSAYFERIPGVWAQGDFATRTGNGGFVIHGRSDTTLNPGGVRIGTAEIYRQVEQIPEVLESLVFGREIDGDVAITLLVRLDDSTSLDDALEALIRDRIRTGCTPRHVPSLIVAVDDLPRTRSGKLAELAVGDRVNGRPVRNTSALANPESLERIAAAVDALV